MKNKMNRDAGAKAPKQAARAPRKYTKKVNDTKAAAEPSVAAPIESGD